MRMIKEISSQTNIILPVFFMTILVIIITVTLHDIHDYPFKESEGNLLHHDSKWKRRYDSALLYLYTLTNIL
jgi:hypothetical protein